eukprot:SAG22_NODE_177_length_16160_cov_41.299296_9_plen_236_part_00
MPWRPGRRERDGVARGSTARPRAAAAGTAGRAFTAAVSRVIDSCTAAAAAGGLWWALCVRPGPHQEVPGDFDRRFVASQLSALGVGRELAARRVGMPIAHPAAEFYEAYRRLFPILRPLAAAAAADGGRGSAARPQAAAAVGGDGRAGEACRCLLTVLKLDPASWAVGQDRVHLSVRAAQQLHRRQHHLANVLARRALRGAGTAGWAARRQRLAAQRRAAAIALQVGWRGWRARR